MQSPLGPDEHLEYSEIGEWCRADDQCIYHLASVLLPLSFGALPLAYELPQARFALALASVALYLYWLLTATRLNWFSSLRLARARELEASAGLSHHRRISSELSTWRRPRVKVVRWVFLFVLVGGWAWTLDTINEARLEATPQPVRPADE